MTGQPSPRRRREVIDALRRGTVPANGLDLLAVGLDRFAPALDAELDAAAAGGAAFKAVRGEYGSGKTFLTRYLAERALRRGFANAEVQVSETETPLHKLETVYRRITESLRTAAFPPSAFRPMLDSWLFTLESDAITTDPALAEQGADALNDATERLLEKRLASVSVRTPAFAQALRAYRAAMQAGDGATADGLAAWLGGQPHVGAAAKRIAGLRGNLDHFGAMGFLQGLLEVLRDAGHPGLLLVLDEVETLQRVRGDVRDKAFNALRQLLDEIDAGRYPGLFLVITGTTAFYDGPSGITRLPPLAQRLATDFSTDPRFDNPRAVQLRLPGFDHDSLVNLGGKVRDLYAAGAAQPARIAVTVDDAYITTLAGAVTGALGGKVGVTPRVFLKKLVADILDRVDQFADFDPRRHYALTLSAGELSAVEREAASLSGPAVGLVPSRAADIDLDLPLSMAMSSDAGFDRLHPVITHHLVNSLGWRSLRPLQDQAVGPVLDGSDALLLAPTAGGKTEAAMFPLLTAMDRQRWQGLSVIYVCPLKALLNNLLPRLESYTAWLGRRAALWHGDTTSARRRAILTAPPDVLLTTPESLESMLVSAHVDHRRLFADLRVIVIDEVHAFGGDDRGWHLLAVLERLTRIRGQALQRIGLSATVGNPAELLHWLQGSGAGTRPGMVVAPQAASLADTDGGVRSDEFKTATTAQPAADVDIELDYVGSVANAAKVIATLYRGEKRLVFCDSKQLVEELGAQLRELGVTTYLIHASLSLDERHRAERAFAEGRDCVIVSTSAFELGLDVGDLDRVIQVNAPLTVAAFLQRLGRSGRRPGTRRNCLFLALREEHLLIAAGLLLAWSRGFVEPVAAPPEPRHIVAQQLLALCLQEGRVGMRTWQEWLPLPELSVGAQPIASYLVERGYLDTDDGMLFIGPEAERRFGHRHFMNLMAVFTAPPEFTVLHGRDEIGRTDPSLLADRVEGPRLLLLGGRSWRVTWTDWKRRRCFVEPADSGGRARWLSDGIGGLSYEIARAMRDVLLGANVPVSATQRAVGALAGLRSNAVGRVHADGMVISRGDSDLRWWTWAGYRVNATLKATLGGLADEVQGVDDVTIRLRADLRPSIWRSLVDELEDRLVLPEVDEKALAGLKFSEALPRHLAVATLAVRLADLENAKSVLLEPCRFER